MEKVTVDKSYFDALLRRADFHTSSNLLARSDPFNVSISRAEYDSLLQISKQYDLLKKALYQGGITAETIDLLTSGAPDTEQRNDSPAGSVNPWTQEANGMTSIGVPNSSQTNDLALQTGALWKQNAPAASRNSRSVNKEIGIGHPPSSQYSLRVPPTRRQVSYGLSSGAEDALFDYDVASDEGNNMVADPEYTVGGGERCTIYLSGFSERTTYRDLLSVVKGGKLLSINMRPERYALVTFLNGAAEFLAWAKRNDIYLHAKRIEVKWADRQYRMKGHTAQKVANGATRNILIRSALDKGLTEQQIREDMDHIHNLVVVDVVFRAGDAYVSMNSIHNALFARTCMMSRSAYKGCKIEFFRDECDVPLPARPFVAKTLPGQATTTRRPSLANRFDMLNIHGTGGSSDEENRTPSEDGENDSESLT